MTSPCRISIIGNIEVNAVSDASVVQSGDACSVMMTDKALAVQRQHADYNEDEEPFTDYPIFSRPLPDLGAMPGVVLTRHNVNSAIHVGNVRIVAVRASSYVHAGCAGSLTAKSRIKHIRQLYR